MYVTIPDFLANYTTVGASDPLTLNSWKFGNCTLYANYASQLIRNSIDVANLSYQSYDLCEIKDSEAIAKYVTSALPQDIDPPPQDKTFDWYKAHCITLNFENGLPKVENNLSNEIIGKMFTWVDHYNHTFYEMTSLYCMKEL
ncbi:hypothetical protein PG984_013947 [Apiospora sp. TS-2023a]